MVSVSEKSFGAKLLKAQTLLQTIQGFSGYAPPRPQDTAASLSTLLTNISELNDQETDDEILYTQAVQARQDAFWHSPHSIEKLLSPIRASVEAQFSKDSHEYQNIMRLIHPLRNHRSIAKTTSGQNTPVVGDNEGDAGEGQDKTISQSEQSYGSLHRHFADLVRTLGQLDNYDPSSNHLKPANLQTLVTNLETLHNNVIDKQNILKMTRNERLELYKDLSARARRIKAYVKAEYGLTSPEYNAVKGLEL